MKVDLIFSLPLLLSFLSLLSITHHPSVIESFQSFRYHLTAVHDPYIGHTCEGFPHPSKDLSLFVLDIAASISLLVRDTSWDFPDSHPIRHISHLPTPCHHSDTSKGIRFLRHTS